jgi:predicted GTPase
LNQERVVTVSAAKGWGLDHLLKAIVELLAHQSGQSNDAPGFWVNHRYQGKER